MNEEFNLELLDSMSVAQLRDLNSWVIHPKVFAKVQQLATEGDMTLADAVIAFIIGNDEK